MSRRNQRRISGPQDSRLCWPALQLGDVPIAGLDFPNPVNTEVDLEPKTLNEEDHLVIGGLESALNNVHNGHKVVYGRASDTFRATVGRPIETNRVIHRLGALSNRSNSGW